MAMNLTIEIPAILNEPDLAQSISRIAKKEKELSTERIHLIEQYLDNYLTLDKTLKLIQDVKPGQLNLTVEDGRVKLLTRYTFNVTYNLVTICGVTVDLSAAIPLDHELLKTGIYVKPITNATILEAKFNWLKFKDFTKSRLRHIDCHLYEHNEHDNAIYSTQRP